MANKYSTAVLYGEPPTWVNSVDAERLAAYDVYEAMYKVLPESFTVMLRGVEEPVLVPTAKSAVKTFSRYVGRGFKVMADPKVGTPEQQTAAMLNVDDFVRRERLTSKFKTAVLEMLRKGDAFWYIQADSNKPEGSRISLTLLDPGTVKMLHHPDDPERVVGAEVFRQIVVGEDTLVQRERWLKSTSPDYPDYDPDAIDWEGPVYYIKEHLELDGWETPEDAVVVATLTEPDTYLPVTTLPVYHWKNQGEIGEDYGTSELQGLERVFAGINQAITDEDMSLAMAGLGMYKSGSGGPVDEDGNPVDWVIGPGRVIEDEQFARVSGVASVTPVLEHIKYLEDKVDSSMGITSVARGGIEASVAESGIALAIKLAPTIDAANDRDQEIREVFDNLLHDLRAWFAAVEGWNMDAVRLFTHLADKMPTNREAELKEVRDLVEAKIISVQYAQQLLKEKFGYDVPADMFNQILEEAGAGAMAGDPYAGRMDEEASDIPDDPDEEPVA